MAGQTTPKLNGTDDVLVEPVLEAGIRNKTVGNGFGCVSNRSPDLSNRRRLNGSNIWNGSFSRTVTPDVTVLTSDFRNSESPKGGRENVITTRGMQVEQTGEAVSEQVLIATLGSELQVMTLALDLLREKGYAHCRREGRSHHE